MEENKFYEAGENSQKTEECKLCLFLSKLSTQQKIIGGIVILVLYTLIVGVMAANIQKHIIASKIEKSFEEAFSFSDIKNNTNKDEEEMPKEEKLLTLNQTVTIGDLMELTLESPEWLDEVKPSDTSGYYSYYDDKEGEKYFVVRGKIKNIAGENLDLHYVNDSEILINDTYKANVTMTAEEADGESFGADVKPLQTLNLVVYASVSDEVYNICEKVKLSMDILTDSTYIRNFYDDDNPYETYVLELNN